MEHQIPIFKELREHVTSRIAQKRLELNRSAQLGIETVPEADIRFFINGLKAEVLDRLKPDGHERALDAQTHESNGAVKSLQSTMEAMRAKIEEHRHREYVFNSQERYDWKGQWKTSVAKGALGLAEGVNVYFAFQALFPLWPIALCFPVIFIFVTSAVAKAVVLCQQWHTKALAVMAAMASATALFYALAMLREIVMVESGGMVIPEWLSVVISVFFFGASVFINLLYNPTPDDLKVRQDAEREAKAAGKLEQRVSELSAEIQKANLAASAETESHRRYLNEAASYDAFLENACKEMVQSYRNEYNLFNSKQAAAKAQNNHNHVQTPLS